MSGNWTPGPWMRHRGLRQYVIVADHADRPIGASSNDVHDRDHYAQVVAGVMADEHGRGDQAATAHLIAAAPDLYAALEDLLAAYAEPDDRLCCSGQDCGCHGATIYQQAEYYARAALAKARGEAK